MGYEKHYRYAPSNYILNKKIKKIQDQEELKYTDSNLGLIVTNNPDSGISQAKFILNDISTGDSQYNNRTGGEIRCTSLQFRGNIYISDLGAPGPATPLVSDQFSTPMCRMIIYWDTAINGSTHTVLGAAVATGAETLLDNGGGAINIFSPYNHSTAGRFKILYDKTYAFNRSQSLVNPTTSASGFESTYPNIYIQDKIKLSRKTVYTGSTASIGDISINGLWVTFISNYNGVSTTYPNLYMSGDFLFRLYFKDD